MGTAGANSARCTPVARKLRLDLGRVGGAVQVKFARQVAAPAGVRAGHQTGKLAQLRLAPFQVKVNRHLAQFGGLPQICFQPHDTGIGLFKAEVGADRLAAQPDAPFAGILLPQGHFGIHQRKRQLFRAVFDVDAGVVGLKKGQL